MRRVEVETGWVGQLGRGQVAVSVRGPWHRGESPEQNLYLDLTPSPQSPVQSDQAPQLSQTLNTPNINILCQTGLMVGALCSGEREREC